MVTLNNFLGNIEADPQAGEIRIFAPTGDLVEALKDLLLLVRMDAHAEILDTDTHAALLLSDGDQDLVGVRRILYSVGQHIDEDLSDAIPVAVNQGWRLARDEKLM